MNGNARSPDTSYDGQRAPLQAALARSLLSRLRLPAALEAAYHARRNEIAIHNVLAHWRLVALTIAMLAALALFGGLVAGEMAGLVVFAFSTVFVVVAVVALGARLPSWRPHIDACIGLGAFVVLGGMLAGTVVAPAGSVLRSMAEYGVIFVTIATFTISHLSFRQSVAVVLATNATFLLTCLASNLFPGSLDGLGLPSAFDRVLHGFMPDWLRHAYFAGGAAVIGTLMGLSHEVRDRTVFLQERLLVLEKKELDELTLELTRISREDALTGLANRRHFNEMFAREWSACQREGVLVNLLFIDVDYFKRYNDHYGHQAGDECLQKVAQVLAEQAKRAADLVARYGGEEFVAFFPRTNAAGLQAIAARMIEAVDALAIPHAASDVAPHVTISVGVALRAPQHGEPPEVLLQAADAALYASKQAGRHCYTVSTGHA